MTRQEYMRADVRTANGEYDFEKAFAVHRAYYGQFVTPVIKRAVLDRFGVEKIKASTEPHFNDIPLKEWDSLAGAYGPFGDRWRGFPFITAIPLAGVGDYMTLSIAVCILKEAARQIKELTQ